MDFLDTIAAMQVVTQPFEVYELVDEKVVDVLLPYSKKEANIVNVIVFVEVHKVDFRNSFVLEEATIDQTEDANEIDKANG